MIRRWIDAASNRIRGAAWSVRHWFGRTFLAPKGLKILTEFCVEVAVLWFVFPFLDTLYYTGKLVGWQVFASFLVAAFFLVLAGILSLKGEEE